MLVMKGSPVRVRASAWLSRAVSPVARRSKPCLPPSVFKLYMVALRSAWIGFKQASKGIA